jgi:hypothetical protein
VFVQNSLLILPCQSILPVYVRVVDVIDTFLAVFQKVEKLCRNTKFVVKKSPRHRGLSQIITSLILIAIVSTIGSVVLFRGLGEINTFSLNLNNIDKNRVEGIQEDLLIENIHFDYGTPQMEITITNIGSIPFSVSSIVVTELDTQQTIYRKTDRVDNFEISKTQTIAITTNKNLDSTIASNDYVVSVLTSRGNFFTKFVKPFNT